MQTTNNTILITGGSTGIGLAMAAAFTKAGNQVIICGRRESKLLEAKQQIPQLHIKVCDIADKAQRKELYEWVSTEFPQVNMLINNAGIQKEIDFLSGADASLEEESEIEINLTAAIHLAALFVRFFFQQKQECALVNVTSGLAFIPLKIVPVYCATKAGLHTFTISLRSQLANTNIRVFETAPPIVQTELHREARARKQSNKGMAPAEVATATMKAIGNDAYETIIGRAKVLSGASRLAPAFFHRLLNKLAAG